MFWLGAPQLSVTRLCILTALSHFFLLFLLDEWSYKTWMLHVRKLMCFTPVLKKKKKKKRHFVMAVLTWHSLGGSTYFCAVLQLKLVEEAPGIAQVWFNLHRPQEPLSGFGDFALTPEQPKAECKFESDKDHRVLRTSEQQKTGVLLSHSEQHMGIVFALLQSINTFSFPLWSGLQKHSLCPQNPWERRHGSRMSHAEH